MKLLKNKDQQDSQAPEEKPAAEQQAPAPEAEQPPAAEAAPPPAAPPQNAMQEAAAVPEESAAEQPAEETSDEEEIPEEELTRKERIIRRLKSVGGAAGARAIDFIIEMAQNRKVWIGGGVLAGTGTLGYVGYTAYLGFLLATANQAMETRDYPVALENIELYEQFSERTPDSLRTLARIRMFSGEYGLLPELLADYSGTDPEMRHMQAIGAYVGEPETGINALAELSVYESDYPYIAAAKGVFALAGRQWRAADSALADATDDEDSIVNRHYAALYDLFLTNPGVTLQIAPASPFFAAQETIDRGLGFSVDMAGFNNSYSIPLIKGVVGAGGSEIAPLYYGLRLLAQTQVAEDGQKTQLAASATSADAGLLARYIAAYYFAAAGQYDRAAEVYRGISEESETTLSAQYEAAALWLSQNGAPPEERVFERLRRAIELDSGNLAALNNAAYLEFNFGDAANAERLIHQANAIDGKNVFVSLNRMLIRSAAGQIEYAAAHSVLSTLLLQYTESDTVRYLAADAETGLNNFQNAINHLVVLRGRRPDDPVLRSRIADRYRYLGHMLLAVQELGNANRKFPDNAEIAGQLALYRAINSEKDAAASVAKLDPESDHALRVQAILGREKDFEKAAEAGMRAIEAAPPERRAAVAVDMTRIFLNADMADRAKETYIVAEEYAENSSLFGIRGALSALNHRIQVEDSALGAEEVKQALAEAAERKDVFAQIDLASALIRLGLAEEGVIALENLRKEQRVGNLKSPDLFAALVAGYEILGREEDVARVRDSIAVIKAGKEAAESEFEGAGAVSKRRLFSGSNEAFAAAGALVKQKDYQGAIDIFTSLIEDDEIKVEKPALTFQNRGALYMKITLYDEAQRDFEEALKLREQLAQNEYDAVHYNYINALARKGDYNNLEKQVNARLAEAAEAGGKFAHEKRYLQILARGLSKNGQYGKAADTYQKIVDRYPRDITSYVLLSDSLTALERFDQAISALSAGLEIDPKNITMHDRLMSIYNSLGDGDNARREMQIIKDLRKEEQAAGEES